MTKEQLAELLNGREYTNEITPEEEEIAKRDGLVVIFGASDDLCELRGAVDDELGAYGGLHFFIDSKGHLLAEPDRDDEEVLLRNGVLEILWERLKQAARIDAKWCKVSGYAWVYDSTVPHATFNVMEDGEKYCRGIVISLKEIAG